MQRSSLDNKGSPMFSEVETGSCDYKEDTKKKCFIYVEAMRRPSPSKLMGTRNSIGSQAMNYGGE